MRIKCENIHVKVTAAEKEALRADAEAAGESLSDYVRRLIMVERGRREKNK